MDEDQTLDCEEFGALLRSGFTEARNALYKLMVKDGELFDLLFAKIHSIISRQLNEETSNNNSKPIKYFPILKLGSEHVTNVRGSSIKTANLLRRESAYSLGDSAKNLRNNNISLNNLDSFKNLRLNNICFNINKYLLFLLFIKLNPDDNKRPQNAK
uniref:Uncharacterized protein n=1 Tax=Schistosoma haematobium TaxID=6185 RepID=A0A095AHG6_SCHHA